MLFSGLAWHLNGQVTQHFQKSAFQYKVDIEEVTRGDPGSFQDPKNIKTLYCLSNYFLDIVVPLKGVTQRKPKYCIT